MLTRRRINHVVSAMRSAMVGLPMQRFEAWSNIGPVPSERSVIETIRTQGRQVEICWDDGIVLSTSLGFSGSWDLYRSDSRWRRNMHQARVVVEVEGWVAVCFDTTQIETFRRPNRERHPQAGGVGPNITQVNADLAECTRRLLLYRLADITIADTLTNDAVMTGLGNVTRSEAMWSVGLSPYAEVADLDHADCALLVETAARIARTDSVFSPRVFGRHGLQCHRCRGTIEFMVHGRRPSGLYWCPSCQTHLDPRVPGESLLQGDHTPTHPAELLFLSEAVAARTRLRGFDDVRRTG